MKTPVTQCAINVTVVINRLLFYMGWDFCLFSLINTLHTARIRSTASHRWCRSMLPMKNTIVTQYGHKNTSLPPAYTLMKCLHGLVNSIFYISFVSTCSFEYFQSFISLSSSPFVVFVHNFFCELPPLFSQLAIRKEVSFLSFMHGYYNYTTWVLYEIFIFIIPPRHSIYNITKESTITLFLSLSTYSYY